MTALVAALGLFLAAVSPPSPAAPRQSAPARKKIDRSPKRSAGPDRQISITADAVDFLPGERKATWKGHVVATREDMKVHCDLLNADLDDQRRVRKLTCTGNAHMHQAAAPKLKRQEREAWGEVAVFDNETGMLTVTGAPRARDGDSTMQGEKILFDTAADRLTVERPKMELKPEPGRDPLAPKEPRK